MSLALLTAIAIAQTVFLASVLLLLAGGHWAGALRTSRRALDREEATEITRRFLAGGLRAEQAAAALDELRFVNLAAFLQGFAGQRTGDDWDRIVRLVRTTSWFGRLRAGAGSRLWWRRLRAARCIAVLATADDLLLVHRLIEDGRPSVRTAATGSMRRVPSPGVVSAILNVASTSQPVVRNFMLEVLADSRALALPIMLERLSAPCDRLQLRALLDLCGLLGTPGLLPSVLSHVEAPSLEVRIAAATALRGFPHPDAEAALVGLLEDESWQVRARAASSLGAIGAVGACHALARSLCDLNWWVRLRSAIALRMLGRAGLAVLREVDPRVDAYAYDMACYVLRLDHSSMAEYVGGSPSDYTVPGSIGVAA